MTIRTKVLGTLLAMTALAGGLGTALRADTIVFRDGSVRHGTVVSHNDDEVELRVERDGVSGLIVIPLSQVARIVIGTPAVPARPSASLTTTDPGTGTTLPAPRIIGTTPNVPPPATPSADPLIELAGPLTLPGGSPSELARFQSRGFLGEILAGAVDLGTDSLARLPAAYRELWDQALHLDATASRADTLGGLRALEAAMQELPGGIGRLEAICRRQRQESFGVWMARVHWEVIAPRYVTGQFDLADVRAVERLPLIGLLKQKTEPALEPLRYYFPPIDEKTGRAVSFHPAQLQGITLSNALEIKDKALFSSAVLLAQLRLEPEMPSMDRVLLSAQVAMVNRILSRARDLEPAARMAQTRAENARKAAEERARREAAIARQRMGASPN